MTNFHWSFEIEMKQKYFHFHYGKMSAILEISTLISEIPVQKC